MRRMINTAAALFITISMIAAPEAFAQTRRSSGSSSTSGSVSRSTGSSSSATRSSSSSVDQNNNRSSSSSSVSRSTGSSSSTSRSSSSSVDQNTRSSSSSSVSRSTGSSSSSTSRSSGSVDQNTRSSSSSSVSRSTGSSSSSTSRSSSTVDQNTRSSSSSTVSRSTGATSTTSRSTSGTATTTRSSSTGTTVRSASNVSRSGLGYNASNDNGNASIRNSEPVRDHGGNYRYNDDFRMDNGHNLHRVPPRDRDLLAWDRPGHFWDNRPHYFGYRIHTLPPRHRRITHWGIHYYYYEGIYYRPYGSVYVVCRPPFGTPLERAIDRALFNLVRFSYYCNTYRTYNTVFDNYNVIAQQNLIIAQNNARIAAQNASYALNSGRALTAYELANKLGLVQSYAYANSEYFYQDGVFYTVGASGNYTTIVPPAGALVTSLPDDYETIVMNGVEYYMVDNTVYRTTLFDGQPYLEVLGQMYGSLYNQYSIYR